MKKILIYFIIIPLVFASCNGSSDPATTPPVAISVQNSYDDQAIQKFLKDNYLNSRGKLAAISDSIATDSIKTPLIDMNPVFLDSGVVYIIKPDAQPENGTEIAPDDALKLMQQTMTYIAQKDASTGVVSFGSAFTFVNNIFGSGDPTYDPAYYYVKNSVIKAYNDKNGTSVDHSFYEIPGLREALPHFKSCNIPDSDDYNLQGVIIVPSRAAFARNPHYPYFGYTWNDRCFVFNFQIYNTTPRSEAGD
jgi:hypothetical protein